jgi:hypothetical protein
MDIMSKNVVCWLSLIASIIIAIGGVANQFPAGWGPYASILGAVGAGISGWLADSPLNHPPSA